MKFNRVHSALFLVALTVGCDRTQTPPRARPSLVVRGLSLVSDEGAAFTSFHYNGTVVATGDSASASIPCIAIVRVKLLSGGNEALKQDYTTPAYLAIPVIDGTGEFRLSAGFRNKKTSWQEAETWEVPKFAVDPIGVVPITPIPAK